MERPKLLILDEPMNGLDKQGVLRKCSRFTGCRRPIFCCIPRA